MDTSRRRAALAAVLAVLTVTVTACTTTVTGTGRPLAARPSASGGTGAGASAAPSGSTGSGSASSGSTGVPSGAPNPGYPPYPDFTPAYRSYLYARNATYNAPVITAQGPFTHDNQPVDVDAAFSFASPNSLASCTYAVTGATAQVIGVGDTTVAKGPAAFWTAAGYPPDVVSQAADKWVTVTTSLSLPGACGNDVFFLSAFEPQADDPLTTSVDGNDYLITNGANGLVTVVDRTSGRITAIRTSRGTIQIQFPDTAPAPPTLPPDAVAVNGV